MSSSAMRKLQAPQTCGSRPGPGKTHVEEKRARVDAALGNTLNRREGPFTQDTTQRCHLEPLLSSLTHCAPQSCPCPGKS